MADLHPYQPEETLQGHARSCCFEMQQMLAEIAGLDAVSLQPAAGAQGELTALLVAAAYFRDRGQRRTKVLAPDSAHGTNPASAAMAGFDAVTVKSNAARASSISTTCAPSSTSKSAVFMITNPNTLGMFDRQIAADRRRGARARRA